MMLRALPRLALFCAAFSLTFQVGGAVAEAAGLEGALAGLNSAEPVAQREAAYAACLLLPQDQAVLNGWFETAGWQAIGHDGGAYSYSPAGRDQELWVMLYEDDPSCSVVDQTSSTGEAAAVVAGLIAGTAAEVTPAGQTADGECPSQHLHFAASGDAPRRVLTVQVISGADYSDCLSDQASALLVENLE